MVRISDIAKEVGVSRSLVSKVLSGRLGRSSARPDLATKIHARAKELGYVPNASAKALFSGRQNVVGVFVHHYGQPSSGLVDKVMSAISRELAKNHQRMLLQFFSDDDEFANCLDLAHPSVMDGVMLACTFMLAGSEAVQTMVERGLPVISMSDTPFVPGTSNVGIEQVAGLRVATSRVVAVPDAATQRDVLIAAGVRSVGQQEIAAPLRCFAAGEDPGVRRRDERGPRAHPQRPGDAIRARRHVDRPGAGIQGRLECRGVVGDAVAQSPEVFYGNSFHERRV